VGIHTDATAALGVPLVTHAHLRAANPCLAHAPLPQRTAVGLRTVWDSLDAMVLFLTIVTQHVIPQSELATGAVAQLTTHQEHFRSFSGARTSMARDLLAAQARVAAVTPRLTKCRRHVHELEADVAELQGLISRLQEHGTSARVARRGSLGPDRVVRLEEAQGVLLEHLSHVTVLVPSPSLWKSHPVAARLLLALHQLQ